MSIGNKVRVAITLPCTLAYMHWRVGGAETRRNRLERRQWRAECCQRFVQPIPRPALEHQGAQVGQEVDLEAFDGWNSREVRAANFWHTCLPMAVFSCCYTYTAS